MKLAVLLSLVLVVVVAGLLVRRQRAVRAARIAAERARARAAARRNRVPAVSSNVKGVTASQTMNPYRPVPPPADPADDEVA